MKNVHVYTYTYTYLYKKRIGRDTIDGHLLAKDPQKHL